VPRHIVALCISISGGSIIVLQIVLNIGAARQAS